MCIYVCIYIYVLKCVFVSYIYIYVCSNTGSERDSAIYDNPQCIKGSIIPELIINQQGSWILLEDMGDLQ